MKTYLITGGAGFIGTNLIKKFKNKKCKLIVLDKLSYAGKIENIQNEIDKKEIEFIKGDICNKKLLEKIFSKYDIDYVINLAAESHVDRSIKNSSIFFKTNMIGVQNLLEVCKKYWKIGEDKKFYPLYKKGKKFLQISTDEVYGSLKRDYKIAKNIRLNEEISKAIKIEKKIKVFGKNFFDENSNLLPNSPYSSSKASADLIIRSYFTTYKLPVNITRCSNNYGFFQLPEKLIPLTINKILNGEKIPVYGDGTNVRDWIHVEDHINAINLVLKKGKIGEIYNVGAFNEIENINLVKIIIDTLAKILKQKKYKNLFNVNLQNINYDLINFVKDRLGHDERYAIDPTKIIKELKWKAKKRNFKKEIEKIIIFQIENHKNSL